MPSTCPLCKSRKAASIKATQRLALCAEAVNLLLLSRLKACCPVVPKSDAYLTLEKLSGPFNLSCETYRTETSLRMSA
jgi:hypothetical protein